MALAAFAALVPDNLLELTPGGILNVHPSLLPRWRGAAPIQSALLAGDTETGVSIIRLVEALDAGPILLQERVPIAPEDDYVSLEPRLAALGARLLVRALAESPAPGPRTRRDATYSQRIERDDARIDWSQPARRDLEPGPRVPRLAAGVYHLRRPPAQSPARLAARDGRRRGDRVAGEPSHGVPLRLDEAVDGTPAVATGSRLAALGRSPARRAGDAIVARELRCGATRGVGAEPGENWHSSAGVGMCNARWQGCFPTSSSSSSSAGASRRIGPARFFSTIHRRGVLDPQLDDRPAGGAARAPAVEHGSQEVRRLRSMRRSDVQAAAAPARRPGDRSGRDEHGRRGRPQDDLRLDPGRLRHGLRLLRHRPVRLRAQPRGGRGRRAGAALQRSSAAR